MTKLSKETDLRSAVLFLFTGVLLALLPNAGHAQSAAGRLLIGVEQRFRSDDWNNVLDMSDAANDQRDQLRDRTRLWMNFPATSNIDVCVGLAMENTQRVGSVRHFDEAYFDQAYVHFHRLFTKGL